MSGNNITQITKEYYGKILHKSSDLKTNACCTNIKYPNYIKNIMTKIHDEILSTYYGCGLVIPDCLSDLNIMDLGCGTGRDAYILSHLVGKYGNVTGIDMTDEQLKIANGYIDYHTKEYGYDKNNINFVKGYIEKLNELQLKNNSYDVIVSNCVVNLSSDKEAVFNQAYNLLKTGGEMYFSDVYTDRRIPNHLKVDKVLWGECLSGALYLNDFLTLVKKCGFNDPRMVSINKIKIKNVELEEKISHINFYSITYRLFKLPNILDDNCEDYGQAVLYNGTIEHNNHRWKLDDHHLFETNKITQVCQNTFNMLYETRFREHFTFLGKADVHYGIFPGCGQNMPFDKLEKNNKSGDCC
jgi:arsenite methyltransferase